MHISTFSELESLIGKHPTEIDDLVTKYFDALRDEMTTADEQQRLSTCNPRYI